jgi:hypothetical protein
MFGFAGLRVVVTDLGRLPLVRRLLGLRAFQFLLVLPTTALVGVALCSAAIGVEHPSFNFGSTFTWIACSRMTSSKKTRPVTGRSRTCVRLNSACKMDSA